MINLKGAQINGRITIDGKSYVQNPDGTLREATEEEIAEQQERSAAYAQARAARKTGHEPDLTFSNIEAGRPIEVTVSQDGQTQTYSSASPRDRSLLKRLLGIIFGKR